MNGESNRTTNTNSGESRHTETERAAYSTTENPEDEEMNQSDNINNETTQPSSNNPSSVQQTPTSNSTMPVFDLPRLSYGSNSPFPESTTNAPFTSFSTFPSPACCSTSAIEDVSFLVNRPRPPSLPAENNNNNNNNNQRNTFPRIRVAPWRDTGAFGPPTFPRNFRGRSTRGTDSNSNPPLPHPSLVQLQFADNVSRLLYNQMTTRRGCTFSLPEVLAAGVSGAHSLACLRSGICEQCALGGDDNPFHASCYTVRSFGMCMWYGDDTIPSCYGPPNQAAAQLMPTSLDQRGVNLLQDMQSYFHEYCNEDYVADRYLTELLHAQLREQQQQQQQNNNHQQQHQDEQVEEGEEERERVFVVEEGLILSMADQGDGYYVRVLQRQPWPHHHHHPHQQQQQRPEPLTVWVEIS